MARARVAKVKGTSQKTTPAATVFRAGCERERDGPADLRELAYTALEYPECPGCPHRLEPEDGPAFCRWLPREAPHPFANLADLRAWTE